MYRHVCYLVTMVSLTVANTITFCPMSCPLGENVYAPEEDTSNATAVQMISECALICFRSADCKSFSYNKASQLCFLITNQPTAKSNGTTDGISYQMEPDRFVGSPGGCPVVDAQNCSFPFTHNGQLYHSCFKAVADPENLCNRYACLLSHRQYATCRPPVDFVAPDIEVTLTVGVHVNLLGIIGISLESQSLPVRSIGGWILIQQKLNDNLSFDKLWIDYRNGFGNFSDNYWMGMEYMWGIVTGNTPYRMRVEIQLESKLWYSGEYDLLSLGDETAHYPLSTSGYSGDIEDPLQGLNGMKFSTSDQDSTGVYCPSSCKAGWWYNSCNGTNFNGAVSAQSICFGVSDGTSTDATGSNQIRKLSVARMMIKAV